MVKAAKRDPGFAERFGMKRPLTVTEMLVALFCSTMIVLVGQQLLQPSIAHPHDGGDWGNWSGDTYEVKRHATLAFVEGAGVKIYNDNGRVTVERGGTDQIAVDVVFRSKSEERAEEAAFTAALENGRWLTFTPEWPGGKPRSGESVEIRITMPSITDADIETDNGRIEVTGSTGMARLVTDNGRITVTDHDGDATLKSDNGRITATGIGGAVIAQSDNGRLTFENVGGRVTAESDNGRITLVQSETNNAPFELQTDNGRVTVELSESFNGFVFAKSGNGRVQIGPYEASDMKKADGYKKNRLAAKLDRGQLTVMPRMPEGVAENTTSTIHTSNGRITVDVRGMRHAQMSTTPGA